MICSTFCCSTIVGVFFEEKRAKFSLSYPKVNYYFSKKINIKFNSQSGLHNNIVYGIANNQVIYILVKRLGVEKGKRYFSFFTLKHLFTKKWENKRGMTTKRLIDGL